MSWRVCQDLELPAPLRVPGDLKGGTTCVRGGCAILRRQQGISQTGTNPGRRTIVSDLSLVEQRLLGEFAHSLESTGVYRAARRSRVPVAWTREIVADLERQGVLMASVISELDGADGAYWDRLGADAKGRGAVLPQVALAVHGVSALAQEAALWLAEAGVGIIPSTRSPQDGGLAPLLSARLPALRTQVSLHTRPGVMVTVDAYVVGPLLARRLVQEDVVHLPVVADEAGVRIGPVLGGGGPCSTCLNLWGGDASPYRPALATQMCTLPMSEVEHLVLHKAAASMARAVTGTLVAQVTRADRAGNETESDGVTSGGLVMRWFTRSVEVTGQESRGRHRVWEHHPKCLCSQL